MTAGRRVSAAADRTSTRWLRLRGACRHGARGVNLDRHADMVWLTLERLGALPPVFDGGGHKPVRPWLPAAKEDDSQ